jgi:hypothetical protein
MAVTICLNDGFHVNAGPSAPDTCFDKVAVYVIHDYHFADVPQIPHSNGTNHRLCQ